MVGGPEISHMVGEFEQAMASRDNRKSQCHHEVNQKFQARFVGHVSQVLKLLREDGNPFAEQQLRTADIQKIIMTTYAEKSVVVAKAKGQEKYHEFVQDRLVYGQKALHAPIQGTNLELFAVRKVQSTSQKLKITDLKHDANTFWKLYVACQICESNVDDFFAHENNSFPPSISEHGKLRKAKNKSDILACIEEHIPQQFEPKPANTTESAMIVDGAALVHQLSPGHSRTFSDYCTDVFWPHVCRLLQSVQRMDVVFDCYLPNSLKAQTREGRGCGHSINVTPNTMLPRKFQSFLAVDGNKQQLFNLLAHFLVEQETDNKVLVCTVEDRVCTAGPSVDTSSISPCSTEEADGRLLLHADHAAKSRFSSITIRTVDSDVIVIAVYAYHSMSHLTQLWIDFGVGKNRKLIPVHELCTHLPQNLVMNFLIFHAFTGCDTVSSFAGIGKRSAWRAWLNFRDIDEGFNILSSSAEVSDEALKYIERYVVLLYDRTSMCTSVNECRRILYTKRNRAIENVPPTRDALVQHCKRAALQAHIWTSR